MSGGTTIRIGQSQLLPVLGRLHLTKPQTRMLLLVREGAPTVEHIANEMGTTTRARGFEENLRSLKSAGYMIRTGTGGFVLADYLKRLPCRTRSEAFA